MLTTRCASPCHCTPGSLPSGPGFGTPAPARTLSPYRDALPLEDSMLPPLVWAVKAPPTCVVDWW
eukprot:5122397-Pyramimonas_sp.AAC.2